MTIARYAPTQLAFDVLFDALPDVTLRDQRDALERPLVSLSKRIRFTAEEFRFGDLVVRVDPHQRHGQPTIWDYDIIIYLLGQVNARFQRQRDGKATPPPILTRISKDTWAKRPAWEWERPAITVNPRQLLTAIGRGTGGSDFRDLRAAIARLQTCQIETNLWHAKRLEKFRRFTLIQDFEESRPTPDGSGGMRFVLPGWMLKSVENRKGILTISQEYFSLSGGYERFLYRMARKLAGRLDQPKDMLMTTLHERSGSPMRLADFAKAIRRVVKASTIPEYRFWIEPIPSGEKVWMEWRLAGSETPQETDLTDEGGEQCPV